MTGRGCLTGHTCTQAGVSVGSRDKWLQTHLAQGVGGLLAVELCLEHHVLDGVVAGGREVGHGAPRLGRQHHVVADEVVLLHEPVHVAARDVGPDAQLARLEVPLLRDAQTRRVDSLYEKILFQSIKKLDRQ